MITAKDLDTVYDELNKKNDTILRLNTFYFQSRSDSRVSVVCPSCWFKIKPYKHFKASRASQLIQVEHSNSLAYILLFHITSYPFRNVLDIEAST